MKTTIFILILSVILTTTTVFAGNYRVYKIKGKAEVNTGTGKKILTSVGQTFICNNPKTDIKPLSTDGYIEIIEVKKGANQIIRIKNCKPNLCVATAAIHGGGQVQTVWEQFAYSGDTKVLIKLYKIPLTFKNWTNPDSKTLKKSS